MRDTVTRWRRHSAIAGFLCFLPLLVPAAFTQTITTAEIAGAVSDSSGAIVPGANVTIKSLDTGESRSEASNTQGQYRFSLLKPGNYEISAASQGLKSNLQKVTLLVGQAQELNISMAPQGTSTTVEVTGAAAILATENANLETNFNKSQVDALPMPGGDLTTLAMTAPGIRVNVTGGSSNMNANGIPGASILYTMDGMDQNDPANNLNNSGASNNLLGANAVSEVAVVMNAYSPQYGRMAGANVNMVGISGANQFHGNLFYNFNWEQLNANSFFNNAEGTPRGRSDAHQFGGRIGGPVKKNKVFFFFDMENLRYVLPASGVVSLPSSQLQAYTLANVGAAELPLYQDYFKLISGSPGINRAVPVTNGPGPLQDGNGHLGCGINSFTGTPAPGGGTFGVNVPCAVAFGTNNTQLNTELNYTPRVDWNISDKQKIFFKFNRDQGVQATGTSPINPLYNAVSNQPANQYNVTDSWIITPTAVNNITASALWYSALFGLQNFSQAMQAMPEQIGISDGGASGSTGFATVGGGTYPNGYPAGRNVGHFQINDDFSWIRGTHTLKAGVNARYDQYTYSSIAQSAFVGAYSIGDLADFANGTLNFAGTKQSSFSQSYPLYGALHFRVPSADFYLEDEWAVNKKLKVTYGIRLEKDFNPTCVENCFVLTNVPFTSSSYQAGASVPYNATLQTKSNLFYNAEAPIVQPRLGIAYKPFENGKTVIRGGVGLFSTTYSDGLTGTLANQVPNKFAPSGLTLGTVGVGSDPNSSAYIAQLSANAFQNGFKSGYTLAQIQNAVKPATFSTPAISSFPNTFLAPKSIQWSFEVEQQLTQHNVFTVSYVGNHGYDLQESVNANMYANPTSSVLKVAPFYANYGGLPSAPLDPRFTTVTQYYTNGISNYNALTVQLRHAFSYGLTGEIHYTWSHALGNLSTTSTTPAYANPYNLNNSYGSLGFDNRHQVAGDLLWNQPFKTANGLVNALIQGWTIGAKMYIYSGAPFSVTDSKIASSVNNTGVITPVADLLVPNAVNADCGRSGALGQSCLSKTDFATYPNSGVNAPLQSDWGNIAPNSFRGPGYFDIDTTLERNFAIKERFRFTFGAQAYNLLNHANFANPSGSLTSGSFGTITTTLGPPTSIYGTGQGSSVSGRLVVLTGRFTF